jgi:hypothetical protein
MPRAAASAEFAGSAETWGRRGFGTVQDAGVWRHPGREALA